MVKQFIKVQKDALARYKRIADLWVAYYVHGEDPSEFGREFYHAVGELLEGVPVDKLMLHHVTPNQVESVVFTGRSNEKEKAKKECESTSRKSSGKVSRGKREKGRKQQHSIPPTKRR